MHLRDGLAGRDLLVLRRGLLRRQLLGLRGANARSVVEGARARFPAIQALLPEGVELVVFYDRADLIGKAVWTVQKVLLEAIVLVVVLLILFPFGLVRRKA